MALPLFRHHRDDTAVMDGRTQPEAGADPQVGSVRGGREPSVEEIAATQGFTQTLAEKVKAAL
jgi:hypothetical protein